MKHSKQIPAIYFKIKKFIDVKWDKGLIISYGDTYHCRFAIPECLVVHETVHMRQQGKYGIDAWWDRYLTDKNFRLSQEVEAYTAQLFYIHTMMNEKRVKEWSLSILADISGPLYGNMVSRDDAIRLLKLSQSIAC